MADASVTVVLELLSSILREQVEQQVTLVVGVEEQIQNLTRNFEAIQAVLDDAEKRQVREATVRRWLDELKDASYDVEDLLDEWNSAILRSAIDKKEKIKGTEIALVQKKVLSFFLSPCFCFSKVVLRRDISLKIKQLNERLDVIAHERERYMFREGRETVEIQRQITASIIDVSEVHGRDQDKIRLLSMLLGESHQGPTSLHIISVVGMGGLGKTTLAQLVYNDNEVNAHFDKKMWVCVSDPFDEIRIAKAILENLTSTVPDSFELEILLQRIRENVMGKKFFLVLDDVWTEDYRKWEKLKNSLKCGSSNSRILVTTRKDTVAKMIGSTNTVLLEKLSEEECWSLLSQVAFFGRTDEERENLEDIGCQIAVKCRGLPLAAKTLGSLMRFKERREEWENVLNSGIWRLEGVEEYLFSPLLLSYYDLPSAVRQCFSYCAIFMKDQEIRRKKLIKMWMAQGYLCSKGNLEMEAVGEEYFKTLATRSFFQDFEKDEDGRIWKCKMHDIVHDFAQFLTKNECFLVECFGAEEPNVNLSHEKARHVRMVLENEASIPVSICNIKKLRSLIVEFDKNNSIIDRAQSNSFTQLTCLRTLDLSKWPTYCGESIEELPKDVGKLIHLRFLDLSGNKNLKELPESVCELCNLQTLKIVLCENLERLPHEMGKLINLRHLEKFRTSKLSFMPKGIARLTSLLTLDELVMRGNGNDSEAITLGDLKQFNNLQGSLRIIGLGNVTDVQEARNAQLLNLKHIRYLVLEFNGGRAEGETNEVLLEALQPPPNLESLEIKLYVGAIKFPNWLMSLTKLNMLRLCYFTKFEILPPLGKLPSIETLVLTHMMEVEKVGIEFLGIETDSTEKKDEGETPTSSSVVAFPKLKRLVFEYMDSLEEWDFRITTLTHEEEKKDINTTSSGSRIIIMPQLRYLDLSYCKKLKALPDHLLKMAPLEKLTIYKCPILEECYRRSTGEDWHKISHIPNIKINGEYVQRDGH